MTIKYRIEKDTLGTVNVPEDAYYGAQTQRAIENYPISGIAIDPILIKSYSYIKKAAALANSYFKVLEKTKADAIIKASDELINGLLNDQIKVDVYQAGAGTSLNMNINEVIANRALEILGYPRGSYHIIHPNDHVNLSQSTNDTFPTALRIATIFHHKTLLKELLSLLHVLKFKSKQFKKVIKSGRTHLQDAMPTTLGQEFNCYASIIANHIKHLKSAIKYIHYLAIGGTAIGTGVNAPPNFSRKMVITLREITGLHLKKATNLMEKMQSMSDLACYSSALKNLALDIIKITSDLRLMASGPRTGLGEIELPAVQPGSSIMPGKINPSICEALLMICFQVAGNDTTISFACQAGQLELNVTMPLIAYNLLSSINILKNGINILTNKCMKGIKANIEKCYNYYKNSLALATFLSPIIGYEKAAEIAKESKESGKSILEIAQEKNILTEADIKKIFKL